MAATQLLGRALIAGIAIAGSVLTPATATAQPAAATNAPTNLNLTVSPFGAPQRATDLTCTPVGGSHPDAGSACSALTAAGGDFRAIETGSGNVPCTMVYSPVTVNASGTWHGTPVVYQETFDNACLMSVETGAVFHF